MVETKVEKEEETGKQEAEKATIGPYLRFWMIDGVILLWFFCPSFCSRLHGLSRFFLVSLYDMSSLPLHLMDLVPPSCSAAPCPPPSMSSTVLMAPLVYHESQTPGPLSGRSHTTTSRCHPSIPRSRQIQDRVRVGCAVFCRVSLC